MILFWGRPPTSPLKRNKEFTPAAATGTLELPQILSARADESIPRKNRFSHFMYEELTRSRFSMRIQFGLAHWIQLSRRSRLFFSPPPDTSTKKYI